MAERGRFDFHIRFADLVGLLRRSGYSSKQEGSHVSFRKEGRVVANLQPKGKWMAKPYQVRQVRAFLKTEQQL
ncbi:hypothetical protein AXK11_02205 [Cephaloticoccus primus]|uniref:Toxin HicA n=1 Tax=Cephaloticoccus primus TaxID=1548207 RepID=A0A139SSI7_9BACT|nr:hypothetical protein [Cephaloticoccus primus]KXU37527.1 hypothetical protein AXK11_02205 [Cephaloticoccus primus]